MEYASGIAEEDTDDPSRHPGAQVSRFREALGIEELPLTEAATFQLSKLPALHQDPFDRMLVCQSIEHGLTLVTPDEAVRAYPIRTLW